MTLSLECVTTRDPRLEVMLARIVLCASAATAFRAAPHRAPRRAVLRMVTADDAIATLAASQAESLAKIRAAIPELAEKPDASWPAGGGETVGGRPARLQRPTPSRRDRSVFFLDRLDT